MYLKMILEWHGTKPSEQEEWASKHGIIRYWIILYCIVLYCTVLSHIISHCIVCYCIVEYSIVLYCIVLYCIVLNCIVLYCIVLYSTVIFFSVSLCLFLYHPLTVYLCLPACLSLSFSLSISLSVFFSFLAFSTTVPYFCIVSFLFAYRSRLRQLDSTAVHLLQRVKDGLKRQSGQGMNCVGLYRT